MSELALQLIEENKRTKETFLDLGNCGLENELPEELFGCVWLEELNLTSSYYDANESLIQSKNKGGGNFLDSLHAVGFASLSYLKRLYLNELRIRDISFLEKLTNLQYLDLSKNQISDISFLEKLTSLNSLNLVLT